jgi:hypothetical protein
MYAFIPYLIALRFKEGDMKHLLLKSCLLLSLMLLGIHGAGSAIVVIAHENTPVMDANTIARLYMGKAIEVEGVAINPVNLPVGTAIRSTFMTQVVGKDDDAYIAYWVVRRSIGRGASPKELNSPADVIDYVKNTSGAIGYVDEKNVISGVKVLLKK